MRKVALLIDAETGYGRSLLLGISKYCSLHGSWTFYRKRFDYRMTKRDEMSLSGLKEWGADGMIVVEQKNISSKEIISMGIPTVFGSNFEEIIPGVINLISDHVAMGKMGAEHLLHCGFHHYAFCGLDDFFWSYKRFEGFSKRAAEASFETHLYKQPKSKAKRSWAYEESILSDWLKSLPRPVGLMACIDDRSQDVLDACKTAGLHVPEEVAIIGVDNDKLICDPSNPPLSSVAISAERAGYEAAELLDKLMAGEETADQTITVRPTHIVTRQSSDILATEDHEVAQAVRFIRQHIKEVVQVSDVLDATSMSRRSLQRRFRRVLNRSVHSEIKRIRLNRFTQMLVETDIPISQIAITVGYTNIEHIARHFRQEMGMSPRDYRKKNGQK